MVRLIQIRAGDPSYKAAENLLKAMDSRQFDPDVFALALAEYGGGNIALLVQIADNYLANLVHIHKDNLDLSDDDIMAVDRAVRLRRALTENV